MKNILYIGITSLLFIACGPKDKQFCQCLNISAKQNEAAEKLSGKNQDQISTAEATEFIKLKAQKDSICAAYEVKGGEELMKLRASCGHPSELK